MQRVVLHLWSCFRQVSLQQLADHANLWDLTPGLSAIVDAVIESRKVSAVTRVALQTCNNPRCLAADLRAHAELRNVPCHQHIPHAHVPVSELQLSLVCNAVVLSWHLVSQDAEHFVLPILPLA